MPQSVDIFLIVGPVNLESCLIRKCHSFFSMYFGQTNATIYTMVAVFWHQNRLCKKYLAVCSDRPNQDLLLAYIGDQIALRYLRETYNVTPNLVFLESDRCSGQFFNKVRQEGENPRSIGIWLGVGGQEGNERGARGKWKRGKQELNNG